MARDANDRALAAWRLVSEGDAASALAVARAILTEPDAAHPIIQMSCAGVLIDAGERLDDIDAVHDGNAILDALRVDPTFPDVHRQDLLYNLALQPGEREVGGHPYGTPSP